MMRVSRSYILCPAERQLRPDQLGLILMDGEPLDGVGRIQNDGAPQVDPVHRCQDGPGHRRAVEVRVPAARSEPVCGGQGSHLQKARHGRAVVVIQSHRSASQLADPYIPDRRPSFTLRNQEVRNG